MQTGDGGLILLVAVQHVEEVNNIELVHVIIHLLHMVVWNACCQMDIIRGVQRKVKPKFVTAILVQVT